MGTHKYIIDLLKSEEEEPAKKLGFRTSYTNGVGSTSDFLEYVRGEDSKVRFIKTYGCRERVCDDLVNLISGTLRLHKDKHYLYGMRCLGEQYHVVAELLKNVENSDQKLAGFFTELFGIKLGIYHNFMTESTPSYVQRFTSNLKIKSGEKTKSVAGYINIYYRLALVDKVKPITMIISAVAALLKEPKIIEKIIDGTITDAEGVVEKLLEISFDRYCGKDFSYDCWNLGFNPREYLMNPNNNDGSDYLSMFKLGLFIGGIANNYLKGQLGGSGPADCAEDHLKTTQIIRIVNDAYPEFSPTYLTSAGMDDMSDVLHSSIQKLEEEYGKKNLKVS